MNNSNLALHSEGAKQTLTAGSDAAAIVASLVELLKRDETLAPAEKEEATEDAESLKEELAKPKPNHKVVKALLSGLERVGSIASIVEKIRSATGY